MFGKKTNRQPELEERIINVVSEKQPIHIGEIFKALRISPTKGLSSVMTMINQGKLNYAANNQVHV